MRLVGVLSLLAALGLLRPADVGAQSDVIAQREAFERYCATCHGVDGKGAGVLSGFLEKPPADLTQLAKKNGGEFPFHRTMQFIDGTKDVRAHGDPDMPVWGEVFAHETRGSPAQQAEIRAKILQITSYVRSIQVDD